MDDKAWERIKCEYIHGRGTQKKLAAKYGIPFYKIARRCREEGWTATKRKNAKRAEESEASGKAGEKSPKTASEKTTEKNFTAYGDGFNIKKKLLNLTKKAVLKTGEAVAQLETQIVKGEAVDTGMVDMQRLRQIVQTVKDLHDITKDFPVENGGETIQEKLIEALKAAVTKAEDGNDV